MSDLDVHEVTKEDWSYGEIAPTYQGHASSNEYKMGSALMYNCLPRAGGGHRRRPGTRFVYVVPADSQKVRKVTFSAKYGQQFALVICLVSGVATIYVFSQATHAFVTTITANVPAYALSDLAAINYASTNGTLWLFMSGTAAGTTGGCPVCEIVNANPDGSGAWSASQPTFTNATAGSPETFASVDHYPACGEFYGGRLFMSGINANPTAQWACTIPTPGVAQTYLVFTIPASNIAATDGIYLLQNDMNASRIWWLFASQSLLAGTDNAVWMYPDGVTGTSPAPATYWMKKSATYGVLPYSRPQQVVNVNLYLGADAKTFRSLILSLQRGFFSDSNLSEHAEHLFSRTAVDFWVTVRPEPIAWIQMADGTLLSASVKQQDTGFIVNAGCGFAQHQLGGGGQVIGGCKLFNTNYDELWLAVQRGSTVSIEYLYLDDINKTAQEDSFYVDCGGTFTSVGGATHFTGLPSPLGTKIVAGLGDGKVLPLVTCDGADFVDYNMFLKKLQVGFPYYSAWMSLRPILPSKGAVLGMLCSVEKAWMLVYRSLGGWAGHSLPSDPLNNPGETLIDFWPKIQIFGDMTYGNAPALKSGFIPVDNLPPAIDDSGQLCIVIKDPVPFNMTAITTRYKITEV